MTNDPVHIRRLVESARSFAEANDGPGGVCRVPQRTVKELCDLVERFVPGAEEPFVEDRYTLMGQTSIGGAMFSLWDREANRDVVRSIPDGIAQKIVNALNRKPEQVAEAHDTDDAAHDVARWRGEATCKGSLALGTGCGTCSKCDKERAIITAPSPLLEEIEFKPVDEVDPRHDHRWIGE